MEEFMLFVKNDADANAVLPPDSEQTFIKACQIYIEGLLKNGNLRSAQPLVRDGKIISGVPGNFSETPYNETKEIKVGYYHILAKDMDEAIEIAKRNPEFMFKKGARIEVRPIKMVENSTQFIYPSK